MKLPKRLKELPVESIQNAGLTDHGDCLYRYALLPGFENFAE
jgi:hypothetical protein